MPASMVASSNGFWNRITYDVLSRLLILYVQLSFICHQVNKTMELVFASYSFDVWESWTLEGSLLDCCKLVNRKIPSVCPVIIIYST